MRVHRRNAFRTTGQPRCAIFNLGSPQGTVIEMKSDRKISVLVNRELLAKAQKFGSAGISETVRRGLELLVANDAYAQLLKMRGKVKFSVDLNELRRDR
jgi:hypothetical protein